jgi:hypothetical protein
MRLAQSTRLSLRGFELLQSSLLLSILATLATAQSTGSEQCSDVHLFLARGDQEGYPGRLGQISTAVCNDFGAAGTCDYEDIVFTTLVSTTYCGYYPRSPGSHFTSTIPSLYEIYELVIRGL